MILADKIISLRKKCGWSQEELAEQLGISRQSVSKWESGMSIPDIDKIIKLSELFGVSTDYLLKDELEESTPAECKEVLEENVRTVSVEEANTYMNMAEAVSNKIATAVALFILSPVALIVLGGVAEYTTFISENLAGGIGVTILLLIIAMGLLIVIPNGMKLGKYEYLENEVISLQYGVAGIVSKKKDAYEDTFRTRIAIGVILCVLAVVPLILVAGFTESELVEVCMVGLLLALIAGGVFTIVGPAIIWGSYQKLLQEGDYTVEEKKINKKISFFPGIYWCIVTAIFLWFSFSDNAWETTWIIWPIAGVLFAACMMVLSLIFKSKK